MGVNHADEWPCGQVAHTNERKRSRPFGVRCWRHDDRMDERRRGGAPHGGRRDGLAPVELDRSREGERLRISQTSTVLRLGEVRGDPRAVVTRTGHVFVRNQSPTLTRERAAAVAHGRPVRGVAKARLRGGIDEGRVALRVG